MNAITKALLAGCLVLLLSPLASGQSGGAPPMGSTQIEEIYATINCSTTYYTGSMAGANGGYMYVYPTSSGSWIRSVAYCGTPGTYSIYAATGSFTGGGLDPWDNATCKAVVCDMSGTQQGEGAGFTASQFDSPSSNYYVSGGVRFRLAGTVTVTSTNCYVGIKWTAGSSAGMGYLMVDDFLIVSGGGSTTLTPSPLTPGFVGTAYSQQMALSPSAAITSASASGLPAGLSINSTGLVTGTPTTTGTSSVSFTVNGSAYTASVSILAMSPLGGSWPHATANAAFSQQITLTPSATITTAALYGSPAGITISSSGLVSGTCMSPGTYPCSPVLNGVAYPDFDFIVDPPPGIQPTTLSAGTVGTFYTQAFTVSSGGGPFSVTSGSLPPGLSLTTAGVLSGTPSVTGTYTFTISTPSFSRSLSLVIGTTSATISPASLPSGQLGSPYGTGGLGVQLTQTGIGGSPAWSVVSGGVPPGFSLTPQGMLTGVPSQNGTYNFTVSVGGNTKSYTVVIASTLVIQTASVPDGVVNQNYTTGVYCVGAGPVYSWSVSAGSLPPGVTLSSSTTNNLLLSGLATTPGAYTFTLQVASNGLTATKSYSCAISATTPAINGTQGGFLDTANLNWQSATAGPYPSWIYGEGASGYMPPDCEVAAVWRSASYGAAFDATQTQYGRMNDCGSQFVMVRVYYRVHLSQPGVAADGSGLFPIGTQDFTIRAGRNGYINLERFAAQTGFFGGEGNQQPVFHDANSTRFTVRFCPPEVLDSLLGSTPWFKRYDTGSMSYVNAEDRTDWSYCFGAVGKDQVLAFLSNVKATIADQSAVNWRDAVPRCADLNFDGDGGGSSGGGGGGTLTLFSGPGPTGDTSTTDTDGDGTPDDGDAYPLDASKGGSNLGLGGIDADSAVSWVKTKFSPPTLWSDVSQEGLSYTFPLTMPGSVSPYYATVSTVIQPGTPWTAPMNTLRVFARSFCLIFVVYAFFGRVITTFRQW